MKKRMLSLLLGLLLLAALLPVAANAADGIAINQVNFPDENFRSFVKEYCDTDRDMLLSPQELEETVAIDVCDKSITSLQGIEFFTELESLKCIGNQLTEMDISNNRKLIQLFCGSNPLMSLNVNYNDKLEYLYCPYNKLTELDVTQNPDLKDIYCINNQLTSLNLKNNSALEYLTCDNNALTALDLSNNPVLTKVFCYNNQITDLDISKNNQLIELLCGKNQLSVLNTSSCSQLQKLECINNQLTSLDLSANRELTYLSCSDNQLTALDLSENTKLKYLYCSKNQLKSLDVSKQDGLKSLYCDENCLTKLLLNENAPLESFKFVGNQLTELNNVPASITGVSSSVQQVFVQIKWTAEGWILDLNGLVAAENLSKVELNPESSWTYDQSTGKAINKSSMLPSILTYYYSGYPNGMRVELFPVAEPVCVVMKENAEQAVVNGVLNPTTQYASGYAKMENTNGTMQMPLRYIAEVNHLAVYYDDNTNKTRVVNQVSGDFIMITQGSKSVTKHSSLGTVLFTAEAPLPFINQNGVTMGPLRFTCEVLDLNVVYQETSHGNYVVISPVAKTPEEALEKIEEAYQLGL